MITKRPLWFGLSIAPLIVPSLYIVWVLIFWTDPTVKQELSDYSSYAISAWVLAIIALTLTSYIASAAFGILLLAILKKINRVSFWWIVLSAVPLGAITLSGGFLLLLTFGAEFRGDILSDLLLFSLLGGVLGFTVATLFCGLVGMTMPFTGHKSAKY